MPQSNVLETLGERVVKAARMAAVIHLCDSIGEKIDAERMLRQQAGIGGADSCLRNESRRDGFVTDDKPL